jgi:phosphoribosylaminoimidazole carboxylase (NCAIR synthetase)
MDPRNFLITPLTAFLALIILSASAIAVPAVASEGENLEYNEVVQGKSSSATERNWNVVMKMLDDCADKEFLSCVGVKVVTAIDRAAKMSDISVIDGVTIIKTEDVDDGKNGRALMTEEELQNSLDQEPEEKTSRLLEYLVEVASKFFRTHAIQFKLPELSSDRLQRAFEEGESQKLISS